VYLSPSKPKKGGRPDRQAFSPLFSRRARAVLKSHTFGMVRDLGGGVDEDRHARSGRERGNSFQAESASRRCGPDRMYTMVFADPEGGLELRRPVATSITRTTTSRTAERKTLREVLGMMDFVPGKGRRRARWECGLWRFGICRRQAGGSRVGERLPAAHGWDKAPTRRQGEVARTLAPTRPAEIVKRHVVASRPIPWTRARRAAGGGNPRAADDRERALRADQRPEPID